MVDHRRCCLEVGEEHCFFLAFAADELSGVDVDHGQGFALVDDQVASRLEPHFGLGGPADLAFHAVVVEDRNQLVKVLDARGEVRHERADEFLDASGFGFGVHCNFVDFIRQHVAHATEYEVEVAVQQGRRAGFRRFSFYLFPLTRESLDVLRYVGRPYGLGRGTHDDTGVGGPDLVDRVPQLAPFLVVADSFGDAHLWRPRKVYGVATRQR